MKRLKIKAPAVKPATKPASEVLADFQAKENAAAALPRAEYRRLLLAGSLTPPEQERLAELMKEFGKSADDARKDRAVVQQADELRRQINMAGDTLADMRAANKKWEEATQELRLATKAERESHVTFVAMQNRADRLARRQCDLGRLIAEHRELFS